MRIALLGPLAVTLADGTLAEIGGARVQALLALLALQPGRTVASSQLMDAIWGEDLPANAANALQTLVKRLRSACGSDAVCSHTGGYSLTAAPDDVDVHRFSALVARARRLGSAGTWEQAATLWAQALREWSGSSAWPGLRDRGFTVLDAAATGLEESRLSAVELLSDCLHHLGRSPESISLLTAETAAYPLRESLAARLITALAGAGRRSEALTAFHRTRQVVIDELGVGPGPELAAAHADVLGRSPSTPDGIRSGPANLPRRRSSFIGRDAELGIVSELLDSAALVTLTGPGGTGKTSLAVETATRLLGGFPDGIWLVELAAVTDPDGIAGEILEVLGVREDEAGPADRAGSVFQALAGRRLLVVDNCEHLLEAVALLVREILQRCPDVKVLATSRDPLNLADEHVVSVSALPLAPIGAETERALESSAVRLFVERAAQARPGFRLTAENCDDVCAICRELDGIPLALELAATRMRTMSPADLVAALADRFAVLAAGRRGGDARHRSLRAIVAWSWDLLTEAERDLARRLAVFAGGTDADTVTGMFGQSAIPALTSLVDKSTVHFDGSRYRMLETIRAYAAEDAAACGVLPAAARRHAEYFTDLVERSEPALRTSEQPQWVLRLTAEHHNIAAALDWAVQTGRVDVALRLFGSLSWFLLIRGSRSKLAAERRRVLALVCDGPPSGLTSAYLACRYAANVQDQLDPQRWSRMSESDDGLGFELLYQRALSEDRRPHPQFALVAAAHTTSSARGDADGFDALTRSSDPWLAGNALLLRGGARFNDGHYAAASDDLTAAVNALRRVADHFTLIRALLTLATVLVRTDSRGSASALLLLEAEDLIARWSGPDEAVNALAWIAHLHYWDTDLDAAEDALQRARGQLSSDVSESTSLWLAVVEADMLRARGDLRGSLDRYLEVIRRLDEGLSPDDPIGVYPAATLRLVLRAPDSRQPEVAESGSANAVALWCRLSYAFALIENADAAAARKQLDILSAHLRSTWHLPLLLGATIAAAALALASDDARTAAVLLGAATSLHQERPGGGPNTARLTALTRAALGDEAFEHAKAEGKAISAEELLDRLGGRVAP